MAGKKTYFARLFLFYTKMTPKIKCFAIFSTHFAEKIYIFGI